MISRYGDSITVSGTGMVALLPVAPAAPRVGVVDVDGQRRQHVGPGGPGEGQRAQRRLVHLGDQHDGVHLARRQHGVGVGGHQLGRRGRSAGGWPASARRGSASPRARSRRRAVNFVTSTMSSTTLVMSAPKQLITCDAAHPPPRGRVGLGAQQPVPVPHHAPLADGEDGEDADDVELDQPRDVGVEGDDEQHREAGQQQDAVARTPACRRGCAAGGAGSGPARAPSPAAGSR